MFRLFGLGSREGAAAPDPGVDGEFGSYRGQVSRTPSWTRPIARSVLYLMSLSGVLSALLEGDLA